MSRRSGFRYYERNGLLPEDERVSGQRRFTEETAQRLGIIDVAKQAGFSLDEVGVLLTSIDEGAPAHKQLKALAKRKGRQPDPARDPVATICSAMSSPPAANRPRRPP